MCAILERQALQSTLIRHKADHRSPTNQPRPRIFPSISSSTTTPNHNAPPHPLQHPPPRHHVRCPPRPHSPTSHNISPTQTNHPRLTTPSTPPHNPSHPPNPPRYLHPRVLNDHEPRDRRPARAAGLFCLCDAKRNAFPPPGVQPAYAANELPANV